MGPKRKPFLVAARVIRVVGAIVTWAHSEGVFKAIIASVDPDGDEGTKVTLEEGEAIADLLTDADNLRELRARVIQAATS